MNVELVNIPLLRKILWADFILGYGTAMAGLIFYPALPRFLGLPGSLILVVAGVTFAYSILAFILARKKEPPVGPVQLLVYANRVWAIVSLVMLNSYFSVATLFGVIFLVLQVLVVAGLSWLEARHLQ
jgi:uncharacterized membrane-anchored protein YitT (DUF2179 family)